MENLNLLNKDAWDAYQEDYFGFNLMHRPDYFEFFTNGGVDLDDHIIAMLGDVKGLKLLDTCCACEATQAFSWHNLGAIVTACDIAPKAIEIAAQNAAKMNLAVECIAADMQTLEPIKDEQYDIVFATYPCWVQNIEEACRTWSRVLKAGGKLLWHMNHPVTDCISEDENGLHIISDYNIPSTEIDESWNGTPLARKFGGWSGNLPTAQFFYRISDIVNAVCNAGFKIVSIHESYDTSSEEKSEIEKLPSEFTILAVK